MFRTSLESIGSNQNGRFMEKENIFYIFIYIHCVYTYILYICTSPQLYHLKLPFFVCDFNTLCMHESRVLSFITGLVKFQTRSVHHFHEGFDIKTFQIHITRVVLEWGELWTVKPGPVSQKFGGETPGSLCLPFVWDWKWECVTRFVIRL